VSDAANRLLARGGRALGMAAVAHARGQRAGQGPWHVLSRDIAAPTEQILGALEVELAPSALAAAVAAAMAEAPAAAAPAWTAPLVLDPQAFARLGRDAAAAWPAGFRLAAPADARERGVALVALALCRSADAVRSLGGRLAAQDGRALVRAARLFQAVARPGEPSAVRAAIRAALSPGGDDGIRD
jgi:hypothetical protein